MAIKRNITDISNLKRGSNTLSAVYRGTALIWPSTPPPIEDINTYNTTLYFNTLTPTENKYSTTLSLYIY